MTGTHIARRIAWWSLLAMVFLVPVVMSDFALPGVQTRLAFSSVEFVKLSLIIVLGLVALAAWAVDLLRNGGKIHHSPIDWLILGLIAWVGITTLTSIHWPTALVGVQERHEGFFTTAVYAAVYFLTLQFAGEEGRTLRLAQTLFFSSVAVSAYGLLAYAGLGYVPEELAGRAFSTFGQPNVLGGFLVFAVAVSLALALQEKRNSVRLAYWSGFGLNGLTLLVTFSRGAWIGGTVAVVLLGVAAWRQRVKMRRIDLAPIGVIAAACAALVTRSLLREDKVTNVFKRIVSIFDTSRDTARLRTEIWRAATKAIRDRPWFGSGPDTFGLVYPQVQTAEYVRRVGSAQVAYNAHDYPLQLAATVGLPGAALFVALWLWALLRSLKTVFARHDDATRLLVGAFWAASVGYLVHLLFDISVPGTTFLLWIAFAVISAPTARAIPVRRRRFAGTASVIVILVAMLGVAGQSVALAADRANVAASDEFSQNTLAERIATADQAVSLNPLVPTYRSTAAGVRGERMHADVVALDLALSEGRDTAQERAALVNSFEDAELAYQEAIAFTPNDYANYVNLAALYNVAGERLDAKYYQLATETAQAGLDVMPLGTDIRERLADSLVAIGRTDEAIDILNHCLEIDPHDWKAALAVAKLYQQRGMGAEALRVLESMRDSLERRNQERPAVAEAIRLLEQGEPLP